MAPIVKLHFFDAADLNGDPIAEITSDDPYFENVEWEPSLGLGSIKVRLNRDWSSGLLASDAMKPETFIRLIVPAIDETKYLWGGFLLTKDLQLVDSGERGAEALEFGGPGPKFALTRAVLFPEDYGAQTDWNLDTDEWIWKWSASANIGKILNQIINEDAANPISALDPFLTKSFGSVNDSNGNPWIEDIGGDDLFSLPIGQNFLDNLYALEDASDSLITMVDLGEDGTPLFELGAYQSFGRDLTGAIGAGNVHLTEGVNINTELSVANDAKRRASHAVVHGGNDADGDANWAIATRPGWSSEYIKHVGIDYERSKSAAVLERVGERYLRRFQRNAEALELEIQPGFSDTTGLYMPGPAGTNGHVWPGDTISLTTGMASPSVLDYSADDQLVTSINVKLANAAADTSSGRPLSWRVRLKLNKEREGGSAPGSSSQASGQDGKSCNCRPHGGGGGDCNCDSAPVCQPDTPDSEDVLSSSDDDPSDWPGSDVTTGSCWGGMHHMSMGASGGSSALVTVSAGMVIGGHVWFMEETGDDPWENVDNYAYRVLLEFESSSPGPPIIQHEICHVLYHNAGCIDVEHFASFTVPSGYDRARIKFRGRLGGWRYRASITEVTAGTPADNDEFCLDNPGDPDNPYKAQSDDPRFDADNQHLTSRITSRVINNSGGSLNQGDVVIPDITFDGQGVTTSTTAAQTAYPMGVVLEGGADDELIVVLWRGIVDFPVNIGSDTAADGDWLFGSATAKAVDADNVRGAGAVAKCVRDDAGVPVYVHWHGTPDAASAGGSSGISRVVKTADETVNNSSAIQADDHLTIAVAANKRYGWRANLWFSSGTTPDIKWEFAVPAGASGQFAGMGLGVGAADNEGPTYAYGTGGGSNDAGNGVGVRRHRRFEGFLKTAGTAGNLAMSWAQNSANASNTVVYEGSSLEIWEL